MDIEEVNFNEIDASTLEVGDIFLDPSDDTYMMILSYPRSELIRYAVELSNGTVWKFDIREEDPVVKSNGFLVVDGGY